MVKQSRAVFLHYTHLPRVFQINGFTHWETEAHRTYTNAHSRRRDQQGHLRRVRMGEPRESYTPSVAFPAGLS